MADSPPPDPVQLLLDGSLDDAETGRLALRMRSDRRIVERLYDLSLEEAILTELAMAAREGRPARPSGKRLLAGGGLAAAFLFLAWTFVRPAPPPAPVSPPSESARPDPVPGWIEDHVSACFDRDWPRVTASRVRLADAGTSGLEAVRRLLRAELASAGLDRAEAVSRFMDRLKGPAPPGGQAAEVAPAGIPIDAFRGDPLARIFILDKLESRLELDARLRRGEPSLTTGHATLDSFEFLADRGDWPAAVRCLAEGGPDDARRLYEIVRAVRAATSRRLQWGTMPFRDGRELVLLTSGEGVVCEPAGGRLWRFSNTHARAILERDAAGRFLLEDVLEGDTFDPEE